MSTAVLWLVTYLVHSTAIVACLLLLERWRGFDRAREWAWRAALFAGLVSASVQVGADLVPFTGRAQLPRPIVDAVAAPPPFSLRVVEARTHIGPSGPEPVVAAAPGYDAVLLPWLAGAGLLALVVAQRLRLRRALGRRRPLDHPRLANELERLRCTAGLRRRPRLTVSARCTSPLALGVLRPEICLPERAERELGPELARAVLAHELAHLARFDPLWLELAQTVRRVLWFQPANALIASRIVALSEFGADELAGRWTGDDLSLARSLTTVADWVSAGRVPSTACAMVARRGALEERVRRLLERARTGRGRPRAPFVPIAVLTALALMPLALPGWSAEREASDRSAAAQNGGHRARQERTWAAAHVRASRLAAELAHLRTALEAVPLPERVTLRLRATELARELDELARFTAIHAASQAPDPPPAHETDPVPRTER